MKKPNILVFLTDDQRYSTIHSLGCDEISTPNLDKFVGESVAFTHAHIMGGTCGAVCMPSRAMIQTGRDLFSLKGQGRGRGSTIPPEHITLPEFLKTQGYYTEHIGKWHQDNASFIRSYDNANRIFGLARGDWYGSLGGHYNPFLLDFDPEGKYDRENAYHFDENYEKIPGKFGTGKIHSTDIFCDAAVKFITEYNEEKPFYMYVATVAPHDPRQSPEEFEEMYNTENVSTPPNFMPVHPFDNGNLYERDEQLEGFPRRKHAIRRHIADYYAMISHLDSRFGDVIQALKDKGIYDDTIVVFAGDNGLALGQHGLMGKQNVYDHSIRVPLIVKPAGKHEVKRSDSYCYLFDIYPTLCEMIGVTPPSSVNGTSFAPVIRGEKECVRDDIFACYRNLQRTYKNRRYKIIEYHVNGVETTQLFDLQKDPFEMNNLADLEEYKELREQMHNKLHEKQVSYHDPLTTLDEDTLNINNVW